MFRGSVLSLLLPIASHAADRPLCSTPLETPPQFLDQVLSRAEKISTSEDPLHVQISALQTGRTIHLPFQVNDSGEMMTSAGFHRFHFLGLSASSSAMNVQRNSGAQQNQIQLVEEITGRRVDLSTSAFYQNAQVEDSNDVFEVGEWLQIFRAKESVKSLRLVNGDRPAWWKHVESGEIEFPILGRFEGLTSDGEFIIQLEIKSYRLSNGQSLSVAKESYKVPRTWLHPLNGKLLSERLSIVSAVPQLFQVGKEMRFRNSEGRVEQALLLGEGRSEDSTTATALRLKRSDGSIEDLDSTQVFPLHFRGQLPTTPVYRGPYLPEQMPLRPSPLMQRILNAAARLTSHEEFIRSSERQRWALALRFTQLFLPWNTCALSAGSWGLDDFDELLGNGIGVCRHNALLLAMILQEAGIPAEVVVAFHGNGGHAWVEIQGSEGRWILDPSAGPGLAGVSLLSELVAISQSMGPDSSINRFYLNPEKQVWKPSSEI